MKTIGLTGGMGSGKSLIASIFQNMYNIPVYNADSKAKYLMQFDLTLKNSLKKLLGALAYKQDGTLDKKYIADIIFNDNKLLSKVNELVHQQVGKDFMNWLVNQNAPYILHEAAILIESGFYKNMDAIITVSAPEGIRIKRIQQRDNLSSEQILQRIKKQITDSEREQLAQFVIYNSEKESVINQIHSIHKNLTKDG